MKNAFAVVGAVTVFFWLAASFNIGQFNYIYAPAGKYQCIEVKL